LGFIPMHSDSQQCVICCDLIVTFTALTRVRIPPGTPNLFSFRKLSKGMKTLVSLSL
jgi:hypothetical protein